MAESDRDGIACDGVPGCGAEVGAAEVFVEIGSADSDECRGDLG